MTSLTIIRRIKASPEAVFAAFIDPDTIALWWGPDQGPVLLAETEARVGGRFHVRFRMEDGTEHGSTGIFEEYDPPHRLSMSWTWDSDPGETSQVEITLRAIEDGTELVFVHARLPDAASRNSHRDGWNGALDKLEAVFAEGQPSSCGRTAANSGDRTT